MTAPRDPRVFRDQARAMEARLAEVVHSAQSADHSVAATVTGRGKLVDLRISHNALDRAHPQLLGNSIVQAVRAARSAAHTAAVPELAVLLGKEPPRTPEPATWNREPQRPTPVERVATRQRPQRRRDEAPYEESFDQVDFLSDEEPDEQGGHR
jgi:DNA-binding protein YbaB